MFDDAEDIIKRKMILFFIIDCSSKMQGTRITAVNEAVRGVLPELQDAGGSDVDLKVACLKFSTGCEWMYPTPISAESFSWQELIADGRSDMGAAFDELDKKLSRYEFLDAPSASCAPVLFLMSSSEPTDDYRIGLSKLQRNNWFKYAIKVAVAIGDDANKDILAEFTGNIEAVITVHTPEALKKWIRAVSLPENFDDKAIDYMDYEYFCKPKIQENDFLNENFLTDEELEQTEEYKLFFKIYRSNCGLLTIRTLVSIANDRLSLSKESLDSLTCILAHLNLADTSAGAPRYALPYIINLISYNNWYVDYSCYEFAEKLFCYFEGAEKNSENLKHLSILIKANLDSMWFNASNVIEMYNSGEINVIAAVALLIEIQLWSHCPKVYSLKLSARNIIDSLQPPIRNFNEVCEAMQNVSKDFPKLATEGKFGTENYTIEYKMWNPFE